MPDYLQFKRVYSNDLLHFGIKRRSGRYPWGSGERPYQSDAKRAIDKAVRRTDKRNDPKNIGLQGSVKNRIASNVKDSHNMFGEKSKSIKKMHDELNNKVYDAERSAISEGREAIQDPSLHKQLEDYLKNYEYGKRNGIKDFVYDKVIMDDGNRRKYFPETDKIIREMDEVQGKYKENIRGQIESILNSVDGMGSERISKIKDANVTYGDIIDTLISRKLMVDWAQTGYSNLQSILEEELVKKYMK